MNIFTLVLLGIFSLSLYYFFWWVAFVCVLIYGSIRLKKSWELQKCRRTASMVPDGFKVIIIGCGFSGIHSGIELKKRSIPFVIYEKRENLGGTWYNNQYPGCHCDVASYLYSFSFEPYNWPTRYGNDSTIRSYLTHCVTKYDLFKYIQFQTEVINTTWDDKEKVWIIKTNKGTEIANVVIDASGILHVPNQPKFKGEENFKGQIYHSTQLSPKVKWDGLKVAIIGTASSAVQMIPSLANTAKELHIFQRTPNWVIPVENTKYLNPVKYLMENVFVLSYLYRLLLYVQQELFFLNFGKVSFSRQKFEEQLIKGIKSQFDEETSTKLIPKYPLGCKRIVISHNPQDYFKTLKAPNVKLITENIQHFTETGIQTTESHFEADMIIFATGFFPVLKKFEIIGKKNTSFKGPGKTFWGITYPNCPNFFMILGPNTALGHNSVVWIAECQVNYIVNCITYLIEKNVKELNVKVEKSDQWFNRIQSKFKDLVWTTSCTSWYKTAEGEIWTLWPDWSFAYWWGTVQASTSISNDYNIDNY